MNFDAQVAGAIADTMTSTYISGERQNMIDRHNDNGSLTKRGIRLDFDGGLCEYRNAALGGGY